jgi:hypothetical protein
MEPNERAGRGPGACEEVFLPLFVIGEIKAGFYGGTHSARSVPKARNRRALRALVRSAETRWHSGS